MITAGIAVGIDVGGTKTQLRIDSAGREREVLLSSRGWNVRDLEQSARWLRDVLTVELADSERTAGGHVVLGAHGAETDDQCATLAAILRSSWEGFAVTVVNDAELVVPAAGQQQGIGLVCGTGAIAIGRNDSGALVRSAGWGWVLSDDGSGSALVREAARAVLTADDRGAPDQLLQELILDSTGASDLASLAAGLSWDGGVEDWARHAPAVFAAAEQGSAAAAAVITDGVASLAGAVLDVHRRGAVGDMAVLAGGVITAQPGYAQRIAEQVEQSDAAIGVEILRAAPVLGALRLAHRALMQPNQKE